MQLTKDNLLADKHNLEAQIAALQGALNYNAGLIAHMDKPEPETVPEPKKGKKKA
jgi:hypothetical protein